VARFPTIALNYHYKEVHLIHAPDIRADKLIHEMKAVVRDTEDLLKATAGDASERATKARAQAEESLRHARASLADMEQHLAARARAAAKATNRYVHENPWPSMGAVAGVAFVVGLLVGRR
jgi:ElaB/YqjD/DUF883 family membrane-anchored ribosome-binding protein